MTKQEETVDVTSKQTGRRCLFSFVTVRWLQAPGSADEDEGVEPEGFKLSTIVGQFLTAFGWLLALINSIKDPLVLGC